ncbi:MAG: flagellar assembly protein FliH [Porphyrobacter sp.]|nr:flagellar assembly protein FliH [Porphyrobacter sp.]
MATSSDWLSMLAASAAAPPAGMSPRWFEGVGQPGGFRPGLPFAPTCDAAPAAPPPAASPNPAPAEDAPLIAQATAQAAEARAFAEGEAAGRAAAEAEAREAIAHARALRLNFRALDEAALDVLAQELAATVAALCADVLGDYAVDSAALARRCEAAAARLGSGWTGAVLHLHPDDAASLPDGALVGWNMAPDPALERGALVIEGPDGAVRDTPADWRRALAESLRP